METNNTIKAGNLTTNHKLIDADGMVYSITKIERKATRVAVSFTHENNDMLNQRIADATRTFGTATLIRIA